jgi:hypothetical protein
MYAGIDTVSDVISRKHLKIKGKDGGQPHIQDE